MCAKRGAFTSLNVWRSGLLEEGVFSHSFILWVWGFKPCHQACQVPGQKIPKTQAGMEDEVSSVWGHFSLDSTESGPLKSWAQEAEPGVNAVMLGMWESGQQQTSILKEEVKKRPPREGDRQQGCQRDNSSQGRLSAGPGSLPPIDL